MGYNEKLLKFPRSDYLRFFLFLFFFSCVSIPLVLMVEHTAVRPPSHLMSASY
jgi:hypothetical protein